MVILPHAVKQEVINVCEKLAAQLSKPHHLSHHNKSVFVTASMGASFYPDDQQEILELIRAADKAMYQVKQDKATNKALYLAFSSDIDKPTSDINSK